MGKSKDYSTGGGKRWLIAIAIIVFVAIAVVVILLCIPPNTYNAVETLNRYSRTVFLESEEESANLQNYSSKVVTNTTLRGYSQEINDIRTLTHGVDEVVDFYNNYLTYASNNKNLKKNYKPIKNNLNDAKSSQKKLAKMLGNFNEVSSSSEKATTALGNGMIDFRREYISWLKYNAKAIRALNKAFTGSLGRAMVNNVATKTILNAVNDFLSVIIDEYSIVSAEDKKDDSLSDYKYDLTSKINAFNAFVEDKIANVKASPISNYYFDERVQTQQEKLEKFKIVYGEKNFTSLIKSIIFNPDNSEYKITKIYPQTVVDGDSEGLFDQVKIFLGGSL